MAKTTNNRGTGGGNNKPLPKSKRRSSTGTKKSVEKHYRKNAVKAYRSGNMRAAKLNLSRAKNARAGKSIGPRG